MKKKRKSIGDLIPKKFYIQLIFAIFFAVNYMSLIWPSYIFLAISFDAMDSIGLPTPNFNSDIVLGIWLLGIPLLFTTLLWVWGLHFYKISKAKWKFWIVYTPITILIIMFTNKTFVAI